MFYEPYPDWVTFASSSDAVPGLELSNTFDDNGSMLEIRLEPELEEGLDRLARETGRTKSYYAEEAIRQFLADRDDCLLGIAALERNERRTSLTDVRKELGLER